jgi:ABC-type nickel/cobalt efflux system permease component RcnA
VLDFRDGNFAGRAGWKEIIAAEGRNVRFLSSSVPQLDRSLQLSNYPTHLLHSPPQDLEARVVFTSTELAAVASVGNSRPHREKNGRTSEAKEPKTRNSDGGEPLQPPRDAVAKRTNGALEEISIRTKAKSDEVQSEPLQLQANKQPTPRDFFTELMATKQPGWGIVLIALAVAVGLGAFHALEPGHGKTVVAAYLVGSRGTIKHALLLGVIVTAAHTAGVYLLGGATLYASKYIVPERLYPWLGILSGLAITSLGLVLFLRRYRRDNELLSHHHEQPHHSHSGADHHHADEGHSHHCGHSHHRHQPAQATSLRELLTLGISGGMIPCPAALVVLLSAVSMNRVGFGLLLIAAFSLGLAAVLVVIGLLMVYAREFMSRFQGNGRLSTRWLPLTSSAVITIFGLAMVFQAWVL